MRPPAKALHLDRRTFLKTSASAAGALLISIPLPPRSSLAARAAEASPSSWTREDEIQRDFFDAAMTNICRCGSYVRIRKAVKAAALRSKTSQL